MVVGSIESEAWRIQLSENLSNIRVQFRLDGGSDEGLAILGTEDQMNKYRRQRLGHCGFPLSIDFALSALEDPAEDTRFLGRCPRLFYRAPLALEHKEVRCCCVFNCASSKPACPAIDKPIKE